MWDLWPSRVMLHSLMSFRENCVVIHCVLFVYDICSFMSIYAFRLTQPLRLLQMPEQFVVLAVIS